MPFIHVHVPCLSIKKENRLSNYSCIKLPVQCGCYTKKKKERKTNPIILKFSHGRNHASPLQYQLSICHLPFLKPTSHIEQMYTKN